MNPLNQVDEEVKGLYEPHSLTGSHVPLQQAPWGGLLHLPQSLHGQDLDNINDHTRDLKHGQDAAVTTDGTFQKVKDAPRPLRCFVTSFMSISKETVT